MRAPLWIKVVLLPVTIPLMIVASLYDVVCVLAEAVWMRMILMARREW